MSPLQSNFTAVLIYLGIAFLLYYKLKRRITEMADTQAQQNAEVVQEVATVKAHTDALVTKVNAFITAVNNNTALAGDPAVTAALADLTAVDSSIVSLTDAIPSQIVPPVSGA